MNADILEERREEGFNSEKGKGILFLFFPLQSRFIFEYFFSNDLTLGHIFLSFSFRYFSEIP